MIDIDDAYDLHVHSAPCLFPRIADDLTIAEAAQAAGLRGLVLKSHHEPTVGRAAAVNAALARRDNAPTLTAFGAITLNHAVGGVNPAAVEAALKTGARLVWMPTVDSRAHAEAFGHTGGWDVQGAAPEAAPRAARLAPLTILAEGRLTAAATDVLRLCRERNVALATGHLGRDEIFALARFARAQRFERLVVTHPLFKVPRLDTALLVELAAPGVYFEFTYCALSPMWRHTTIDETAAAIRAVGVERAFLTSDGGQTHNPMPHEGLRLMAQMCAEKGFTEAEIDGLIRRVPAQLVGDRVRSGS